MKIIIAGAGMGGMIAAERLAKLGFDVTVYEQSPSLDEMRYDWHDDVNPSIFRRLGLEMPAGSFRKKSWTFISPHGAVVSSVRTTAPRTGPWSADLSTACFTSARRRARSSCSARRWKDRLSKRASW